MVIFVSQLLTLLFLLLTRLTPQGPKVLEFNCRFGDPETQVLLPLLENDLYEVMVACCDGKLEDIDVRFKENTSAATVVCAAKGYPEKYPKGMEITGLGSANALDGVKVYHAGTKLDDKGVSRCSGGRVIAVTGMGSTLKAALKSSYAGVDKIDFVGANGESCLHRRTDIGKRATEKKLRIGVLGSTRGTSLIPVIEACKSGLLHAEIAAIISNRASAPILDKGKALGPTVLTKHISSKGLTRAEFDAQCTAALVDAGVEFVLLVGYMRILSKPFTDFWAGRCINVHPSLLPKHAGGMDLEVSGVASYSDNLCLSNTSPSVTGPSGCPRRWRRGNWMHDPSGDRNCGRRPDHCTEESKGETWFLGHYSRANDVSTLLSLS